MARHLAVSALGEAAHLRAEHMGLAVRSLHTALTPLRGHARAVFARTIAANPTRFLMPALAEHGLTLEVLAELYLHAGHAGILEDKNPVTAANVFESLRGRLGEATDPLFGKTKKVLRLRTEFTDASTAVEEVNRLQGLALAIGQCEGTGGGYLQLANQIVEAVDARQPDEGACFAAFPPLA